MRGGRGASGGPGLVLLVDAAGDFRDLEELGGSFVHAVDGARAEGLDRHLGLALGAYDDDGGGVAPHGEFAKDRQALDVGELQVEEEDVDPAAGHAVKALAAGRDNLQGIRPAGARKALRHERDNHWVILCVKHANHGMAVITRPKRVGGRIVGKWGQR